MSVCSLTTFYLYVCSKKMCWWRVLMESDSRWPSDSCQYSAIHNACHTSLHSDTVCPVRIQMCSVHQAQQWDLLESNCQLGLSLETTDTCIVHKQTNRDCASRATTNNSDRSATSSILHKQGEKQQRRRDASASWKEQPRQRGSMDKLDYTSRFVRVIPTFSLHCHETVTQLNRSRWSV